MMRKIIATLLMIVMIFSALPLAGINLMAKASAKDISGYKVGDTITFGSYPQSKVTDKTILNGIKNVENKYSWISYNYYSGTGISADGKMKPNENMMYYKDIQYNGNVYRAVKINSYRPYWSFDIPSQNNTNQYDNGYYIGNIYYFLFEPLEWRVLDPFEGLVMCTSVIDSQEYQSFAYCENEVYYNSNLCTSYASDWKTSSIRAWLNNTFYGTAFTASEASQIGITNNENKCIYSHQFDGETTADKVFLLSHAEALNSKYGFSTSISAYDQTKHLVATDYALCQGCHNVDYEDYKSNVWWRLRTPNDSSNTGYINSGYLGEPVSVVDTSIGIAPALKIVSNPITKYIVTYNANGGSVSTSSETVESGKSVTLPTPTRSGYTCLGWSTSKTATSATYSCGSSYKPTANITLYAVWKQNPTTNIYNLGEESYSFDNYGDGDSPNGHCFGMAVTSSGYYLGKLDKSIIGGNNSQALYSFKDTSKVRKPICYYLHIQGPGPEYSSIVAGGNIDLKGYENTKADWTSCVNYVKAHKYDNTGELNVGMWFADGGGHAVNFLYYNEVNGQQRIYVYDNNCPKKETYYYLASDGYIHQAPYETNSAGIRGMDLMNVNNYFKLAPQFKLNRYIYADKNEIVVEGAKVYNMKCSGEYSNYVMYEVPDGVSEVSVKPLKNNASFTYAEETYSFNAINSKTYATLKLKMKDGDASHTDDFKIYNEPIKVSINDVEMKYKSSAKFLPKITTDGDVKYTVKYESSNPSVATVDKDGKITTFGKGETKITCTVTDTYGNTVKDTCTVTVKFSFGQWLIWILLFGFLWY